jgi:hypothetical protein
LERLPANAKIAPVLGSIPSQHPPAKWNLGEADEAVFKGIDRPFKLRGESRLIRSVITNWMLGKFFYLILKGLHHKISKKPWDAA